MQALYQLSYSPRFLPARLSAATPPTVHGSPGLPPNPFPPPAPRGVTGRVGPHWGAKATADPAGRAVRVLLPRAAAGRCTGSLLTEVTVSAGDPCQAVANE
jgi:hypothetical protein